MITSIKQPAGKRLTFEQFIQELPDEEGHYELTPQQIWFN